MTVKILVVDNYDSFVYTLVGYLQQLGAETTVVRNDELSETEIGELAERHDGVMLSPGPGAPADAGVCASLVRGSERTGRPLFGVCLGHQSLGEVFGGSVGHSEQLMHGKTSEVHHDGAGVFAGVPSPFTATRYHSLSVSPEGIPETLRVTAWTEDGHIMGLSHRGAPIHGVQFHPESVLTESGHLMLGNWLEMCGLEGAARSAAGLSPLLAR
ncbi:aminodeoxychorismate/anthranilate synthase component II [Kocuria palustris]|mgnify:CR=1 FL=1|uniref:anthranilate synthase component II n=1 Tax=Kocuria palustris TaxID=71999 RepID=UPI00119FF864|nr:gamma-glutamyl-gamma-aminobutyrate hydrolase family protein [Kocuria palustris]